MERDIEVLTREQDPGTMLATVRDLRQAEFGRRWELGQLSASRNRLLDWQRMVDDWLDFAESKSQSRHTRRNYRSALERWQTFLATQFVEDLDGAVRTAELWEVEHSHVRLWQQTMKDAELKAATINHALACVSSFYSFVIREKRMVNGVEIDLFTDALGRPRENPFKAGNMQRARTKQYERSMPLSIREYDQLLSHLEKQAGTVGGARNFALVLTYLHTGWRSAELLRMQWKHIRPSRVQPGTMIFEWEGKGAKAGDDVLPADCYHAIVAYLKKDGRWLPGHEEGLQPDDFIWLPVKTPEMNGMNNEPSVDPHRPISGKTALRILRSSLQQAGIQHPERFRIHDLRHTHARLLLKTGHNLAVVQARLHHSSLSTTGIYCAEIQRLDEDPLDTYTGSFRQLRLNVS